MEWIEGMNAAINYMEEHILEDLDYEKLGQLAGMMNTPIQGLLGVSSCNNTDEWRYYVAVASTLDKGEYEEMMVPEGTWAVFYEEGPVSKMAELESRIVSEWLPTSGYEYANAPDVELYINPDPVNAKYEVWIPIVKKPNS